MNENFDGVRNRILLKNIAYAGVVAALIDVDLEVINTLLRESYGKKPKLLDSNSKALRFGYDWAKQHLQCPLPLRLERMDQTRGHIMIDGNTAAGLGCVYAGATVGAWYPITPSTSLMDAFKGFCERYRVDPDTGERNYAVIQAEDELAAIGMVLGASWNGARAFTPTSGPGISLMNEFVGPGLLRRDPVRDLRRAARRAFDRHADPHPAGRHHAVRLRLARRHAPRAAVPGQSGGMLLPGGRRPSIWRSGCRPRCSCSPTWTSA